MRFSPLAREKDLRCLKMGLQMNQNGTTPQPKKRHYKGETIKVYCNKERFLVEIKRAERAGIRRVGLQPYTQKPHGFEWERLANTDDLSEYYKMTSDYWEQHEAERLQQRAELKLKEQKLEEEKKRLGILD
jgi:hypothetical protein